MKNREMKTKRRLAFSLAALCLLMVSAWVGFRHIQAGEKDGRAPVLLRRGYLWNEEVWKILSSSKRLSVKRPDPPAGKKPRVNGMIGLESSLDLRFYGVEVNSGEKALRLSLSAFHLIPKSHRSTEFRCIEGWSEDLSYAGAKFSDFMEAHDLGKKPDGTYYAYVGLETPDGKYYVSIDMESMLHEQTLLAYEMNGKPLSLENGAPLRLIIPVKYGIKSLKRIGRIFFSDSRPPDYWAEQGYDWYSGL